MAVARNEAGLRELAAKVKAQGRRCLTIRADVADAGETVAAARRALSEWGAIDLLVSSAGISRLNPAEVITLEQ